MSCKYKYNNTWYSKEELKSILLKERGILPDGKLEKPEIKVPESKKITKFKVKGEPNIFNTREEAQALANKLSQIDYMSTYVVIPIQVDETIGKQPTQTRENTTSIESVKNKTLNIFDNSKYVHPELGSMDGYNNFESDEFKLDTDTFKLLYNVDKKTYNVVKKFPKYWQAVTKSNLEYYSNIKGVQVSKIIEEQKKLLNEKIEEYNKKEYTSQAEINLKIAALKEVARKYPRSLIRSEVKRINTSSSQELYDQFGADELPFQKVSKDTQELFDKIMNTPSRVIDEKIKNCL